MEVKINAAGEAVLFTFLDASTASILLSTPFLPHKHASCLLYGQRNIKLMQIFLFYQLNQFASLQNTTHRLL